MAEPKNVARLLDEVRQRLGRVVVRQDGNVFIAELARDDGSVSWPNYAHGPDEVLATLAAEQRFLVEDEGRGAVVGDTYVDKARERLRRWETSQ